MFATNGIAEFREEHSEESRVIQTLDRYIRTGLGEDTLEFVTNTLWAYVFEQWCTFGNS